MRNFGVIHLTTLFWFSISIAGVTLFKISSNSGYKPSGRLVGTPKHVLNQSWQRLDALTSNVIFKKFEYCHFYVSKKSSCFLACWDLSYHLLPNIGKVKFFENYISSLLVPRLWYLWRNTFRHPRSRPLHLEKFETTTSIVSIGWTCSHSFISCVKISWILGGLHVTLFWSLYLRCRCRTFQNKFKLRVKT